MGNSCCVGRDAECDESRGLAMPPTTCGDALGAPVPVGLTVTHENPDVEENSDVEASESDQGVATIAPVDKEPLEALIVSNASPPAREKTNIVAHQVGDEQLHASVRPDATTSSAGLLLKPNTSVVSGLILNLLDATTLTKAQLQEAFVASCACKYRKFAGRSILDFKLEGTQSFELKDTYVAMNPLIQAMVALAERSLGIGEELALLQLIFNYYRDGWNEVKPHMHRCRQICASLGAPRLVEVEGKTATMRQGDCLHLASEWHSVPPADETQPRVSVCLFYASVAEYEAESVSVNANGAMWWQHPEDARAAKGQGKNGAEKAKGKQLLAAGKGKSSGTRRRR